MSRLVFLNALPLNAFSFDEFSLHVSRVGIDLLKIMIKIAREENNDIVNYIRHPATVQLLNSILGLQLQPRPELYVYAPGDKIIVVTLKKPVRGQEVDVRPDDLDLFFVGLE